MHFPKIRLAQFGASFKASWQIRDWSCLVINVPRKHCIRMSLFLDQSVIMSADSCSIGTLLLLKTSNTVLSSTYLNMGHGVCKSLIWTKKFLGPHNVDGPILDQERCHPSYKICRQAHAIEFRNQYFVVDVVKSFAIVYEEHSHESIWLIGSLAPRVDHLHQGVRRTGAG